MKKTLNFRPKFQKICIDHDRTLNHVIHMENRAADAFKNLRDKEKLIEQYKDLSSSGSRHGIINSLAKVYKNVTDAFPYFRPILLAIG